MFQFEHNHDSVASTVQKLCPFKREKCLICSGKNPMTGPRQASTLWFEFLGTHIIYSSAYQSDTLELVNLIAPSLYQSALLGYAGISCQLHPLKAKDLMMYRVIQIKRKKDMYG